jgi:hypothetical protein
MTTRTRKGALPSASEPAIPPKGRSLTVDATPGKSRETLIAELATLPAMTGAALVVEFNQRAFRGGLPLTETVAVLKEKVAAVQRGDLAEAEALLTAQAVALNSMFVELASRSSLNMGEHLGAADTYMRLALRAQAQCVRTLETLATIKNPPPLAFVRQANIAHGHQQVNNGVAPVAAASCAGDNGNAPTELLEVTRGERLDAGAPRAAARAHSQLATLGALDGSEDDRG